MSFRSRPVVHQPSKSSVEEYSLPKWDRHGNLVSKPAEKPAVKKVEEVEEVVKPPTVAEIEAIREEAYNEGFEQGYASGMAQGEREGRTAGHKEGFEQGRTEGQEKGQVEGVQQALVEEQAKTAEKLQVFDAVAQQLRDQLATEQTELEQAMLGVAMRIAAQVIQDELRLSPEHIKPLVHAAIQSLPNPDEKLTLKLNPLDIDVVDAIAESHWTLEPDINIKRGGCQVKSGFSYVDYTLDHRYDSALSLLLSQWQPAEAGAGEQARQPFSQDTLLDENSHKLEPAAAEKEPETEPEDALPSALESNAEAESETEAENTQQTEPVERKEEIPAESIPDDSDELSAGDADEPDAAD